MCAHLRPLRPTWADARRVVSEVLQGRAVEPLGHAGCRAPQEPGQPGGRGGGRGQLGLKQLQEGQVAVAGKAGQPGVRQPGGQGLGKEGG